MVSEGKIVFSNDNRVYYPGQMLSCKLEFDLYEVTKFRGIYANIRGAGRVFWTTSHTRKVHDRKERYTIQHESCEEYMHETVYLIGGRTGEQTLRPGRHVIPFECLIPESCPSSFVGKEATVLYTVKVIMDRTGCFEPNQEKTASFIMEALVDLNTNPYCKKPIEFNFDQTFCCCCMNSGSAETIVKLPAGGYTPKEIIPIEVACTNTSSVKIKTIKLAIIMSIILEVEAEPRSVEPTKRSYYVELAAMKKGPVPGNTTRNWTVDMEVPNMELFNLSKCRYITVDYMFKVSIVPSGCHADIEDTRPIIFGNVAIGQRPPANMIADTVHNRQEVTSDPMPPTVNQPLPVPPNAGTNLPYREANLPQATHTPSLPAPNPPNLAPSPSVSVNVTVNQNMGSQPQQPAPAQNLSNPPYPTPSNSPYPPQNTGSSFPNSSPYPPASNSPYPPASNTPYPPASNSPYPPASNSPCPPTSNSSYPPSSNSPYLFPVYMPYTPGNPAVIGFSGGQGPMPMPGNPYGTINASPIPQDYSSNKMPGYNSPPPPY